jgi:hypothetical protein
MNWRRKRDRKGKKREAQLEARRIKGNAAASRTRCHVLASTPCPDTGTGDGEPCPRCFAREVKVHRCCTCGDEFLRCCACGYVPTVEEEDRIVRACEERASTSH